MLSPYLCKSSSVRQQPKAISGHSIEVCEATVRGSDNVYMRATDGRKLDEELYCSRADQTLLRTPQELTAISGQTLHQCEGKMNGAQCRQNHVKDI